MWRLKDALCNESVQREIIAEGAAALQEVATRPASPSVIGTRIQKTQTARKNLTVAELMAEEHKDSDRRPRVAGYFQSVAASETDHLVLTWCTLAVMILFDACEAEVAQNTDAKWAPYFEGGHGVPPLKSRVLDAITGSDSVTAKTPLEVVLSEWQLFERLS